MVAAPKLRSMSASSERRAGVGVGDAEMATGLQSRGFSAREVRILSLVDQDYSAAEIIEILQAGGRDDDPARPLDRAVAGVAPEGRSAAVILLAGLLCAAIFVADLIFGGDDSPILYLLVVPVAILAMEFTTMGALVGAAVGRCCSVSPRLSPARISIRRHSSPRWRPSGSWRSSSE
jgi:hypothetical protein